MGIAQRIHDTVEGWQAEWKDRLRGWMASWLNRGIIELMEGLEPEAIETLRATLTKIADHPATPAEMKTIISTLLAGKKPLPLLILIPLAVLIFLPGVLALVQPVANLLTYTQERLVHSFRLDPGVISRIWLRDKPKWDWLWDDLRDLGYDERRLEAAKELVKIIPPLADMVRFADFSAFDPEVIEKWRQFYDAPGWVLDPFALLGITNEAPRDWANKYWFSHYVQPGRYELGEMYRRGLLGKPLIGQDEIGGGPAEGEAEETIKLAYRTMAYSSFWQDRLLQLVREVPTRVDVRRWWDMRTIDEAELREIYQRQGYFGKDLENYVLWTKVYVAFPDLIARWKNGWITEADVRAELTGLGMPIERVEEMIQTKIKPVEPERIEEGKALTKTEIYKGVKAERITWDQGVDLLMDLNYSEAEADYLLDINVGVLAGSPETFEEFKAITQKYKLATGREEKPMTEELKAAAAEVIRLTDDVGALERSIVEERRGLVDEEVLPAETTKRLKSLQVKLHRAEAELSRAKSEYDRLTAEWRHG